MDVTDKWELDDDGNYMPATEESFVIDPRFKVDAQGNIHLRKQEMSYGQTMFILILNNEIFIYIPSL